MRRTVLQLLVFNITAITVGVMLGLWPQPAPEPPPAPPPVRQTEYSDLVKLFEPPGEPQPVYCAPFENHLRINGCPVVLR